MSEPSQDRLLRRAAVENLTSLSPASIYRLMKTGAFPRPVKTGKRAVAWPEGAVRQWIANREASQ